VGEAEGADAQSAAQVSVCDALPHRISMRVGWLAEWRTLGYVTAHPWSLDDAEFDALMALQRGEPAPPWHEPVWLSLVEKRLVWLDVSCELPALRLTQLGSRYPQSS
jgi:hypothetical protein